MFTNKLPKIIYNDLCNCFILKGCEGLPLEGKLSAERTDEVGK
jgi:hypothetical protein